jgi:lipopolysaccharide/colanic/teichoic acid biosynthesis glycosyltransferase
MMRRRTFYQRRGKRWLDLLLSAPAILLLGPLGLAIALLLRSTPGSPVLFRQCRPGLDGHTFTVLKFRSMNNATDRMGNLLSDEERLTGLGRLLRALSLDELPQLLNVLRGEMSLVGPRPLLIQYLGRYTPRQRRRHEVRPGITGWAQVNGRNGLSWPARFELDIWYVDNCSLALDLKILGMTVSRVLRRSGISQTGHATMPEFSGEEAQSNG